MSSKAEAPPPFASVQFIYGPEEKIAKRSYRWWQLEIRANPDPTNSPLCIVRGLTAGDPLTATGKLLQFERYQLQIPETGETLEYVDIHSGRALLPSWLDFEKWFVPHPAAASGWENGTPETCEFLGHVLTLRSTRHELWADWHNVKRLELDREMLVGTGRNFKDAEGKRLPQTPQRQEYTYVKFTPEDYQTMLAAGMTLFTVAPEQEQYVRAEPVFYLRHAAGNPPLHYPADFYRANYLGGGMFIDEPAVQAGADLYHSASKYYSDTAALIEKRTRATFQSDDSNYGRFGLERELKINLGDFRLVQTEMPVWEFYYETAFYEMKGGGAGIVHEGRYQLAEFDAHMKQFTGEDRRHTPQQMLRYHYAFLRGGTRPFGKFWGTAIYGQCDPAIAPEAFALAYDMGARYFWFWTSDHQFHLPWPEQLELARKLKQYAREHPRPSIWGPLPKLDAVVLIPNGYFVSLEKLWRTRSSDVAEEESLSQRDRRFTQRALKAVHRCLDRGENFDITIDDGRKIEGYKRIVRVKGEP